MPWILRLKDILWLFQCVVDCYPFNFLLCRLIDWLYSHLVDWLIDWSLHVELSIDWLIDWSGDTWASGMLYEVPCSLSFIGSVFNNARQHIDVYGDDVEVDYRGYEVGFKCLHFSPNERRNIPRPRLISSHIQKFELILFSGHCGKFHSITDRSSSTGDAAQQATADGWWQQYFYLHDRWVDILSFFMPWNACITVFFLALSLGHGGDGFLKFQDNEEISDVELADAFQQMWEKKRYNQILFMIDTCQAASMYKKHYSPNIVSIASSQVGQDSFSVRKWCGKWEISSLISFTLLVRLIDWSIDWLIDWSARNSFLVREVFLSPYLTLLQHHHDTSIGVYVIDRYTYYALEFLEKVTMASKKSLHDLVRKGIFSLSPPCVFRELIHGLIRFSTV